MSKKTVAAATAAVDGRRLSKPRKHYHRLGRYRRRVIVYALIGEML